VTEELCSIGSRSTTKLPKYSVAALPWEGNGDRGQWSLQVFRAGFKQTEFPFWCHFAYGGSSCSLWSVMC